MKILVLNGPNMNLLGVREPNVYGQLTMDELNRELAIYVQKLNEQIEDEQTKIELFFYQSNHEGVLIDVIQRAQEKFDGIVYNPAAHTHYSIAIRDAIASVPTPVIEVHLSDISSRESFRKASVMSFVCVGQYMGKNVESYKEGIVAMAKYVKAKRIAEKKREEEAAIAAKAAEDAALERAAKQAEQELEKAKEEADAAKATLDEDAQKAADDIAKGAGDLAGDEDLPPVKEPPANSLDDVKESVKGSIEAVVIDLSSDKIDYRSKA